MSELSKSEQAVLVAWSSAVVEDDPPDYPKGYSAERTVMEALQKRGLFVIEEDFEGERYYVTDAGRKLVASQFDQPSPPES